MKWKQHLLVDDETQHMIGHVWPINDDGTEFQLHQLDEFGHRCSCGPEARTIDEALVYIHKVRQ